MARNDDISTFNLMQKVQTEADAYAYMESLRWPDGKPVCPHCGDPARSYFLNPENGVCPH